MKLVYRDTYYGRVKVPSNLKDKTCTTIAYIAWKRGVDEHCFVKYFQTWFRKFAIKNPGLAKVKEHTIYPVDTFIWLGEYIMHPDSET